MHPDDTPEDEIPDADTPDRATEAGDRAGAAPPEAPESAGAAEVAGPGEVALGGTAGGTAAVATTERPIALQTSSVSYRYGSFEAVAGLSLQVSDGEVYGFLGRNGAGKTTTIKMLMGVLKPRTGTVQYFDEPPRRRATIAAKRQIGYVSQQQHFYPWMTGDALGRFVGRLYPQWDAAEYKRLLKLFEVPADRRAGALSGGMRVKLALALALAPRPKLLILDEPMAGLDAVAQREFLDLVQEQAQLYGRTTFFSSHRIHEVERIGDRIGVIDAGELIYEGTISALHDCVRVLRAPLGQPVAELPAGVELLFQEERDGLRQRVVRIPDHATWDPTSFGGETLEELSLEDIFIAMVRDNTSLSR
ncbi:MAG: ABC transporter ATP-binding protein [Planctomycetota bacterium]